MEGLQLNHEQRDIYNVVMQQKEKIRLRINDLNELEDIFVNFGTRKKGIKKIVSVHYAGLRNPVTALEILNIGDVIRRGKLSEAGTAEHPTSRRYELKAEDGAVLKVIIDFSNKHEKNKSVINFYSDRKSDTGAHNVSSGIITDLEKNISYSAENASTDGPLTDTATFKKWFANSKVVDQHGNPLTVYHGTNWDGWFFDTASGAWFS